LLLYPPQIPRILGKDRTQACTVTGRQLTTSVTAWPIYAPDTFRRRHWFPLKHCFIFDLFLPDLESVNKSKHIFPLSNFTYQITHTDGRNYFIMYSIEMQTRQKKK